MKTDYAPIFANKTKSEIEAELHEIMLASLTAKYGKQPDARITERVQQEWHAMEAADATLYIAALVELTIWMERNGYAYWHTTGSASILFYLLGITYSNPLPAHYVSLEDGKVIWKDEYKDGFDMPYDYKDASDGNTYIPDGHNIPWQTFWGYDKPLDGEVRVLSSLHDEIITIFKKHWLRNFHEEAIPETPFPEYKKLIRVGCLTFVASIEECNIHTPFRGTSVSAEEANGVALDNWEALVHVPVDLLESIEQPSYFSDLVALCGLMRSTNGWDEDSEYMVNNLGYSLSDLICHRDDVFFYLQSHGFIDKDAWRGAECVRKNKELPVITAEMVNAKDKWVLDRCERIRYLFPKAHSVEYIFFCIKTGHFVCVERQDETSERHRHHGDILERLAPQTKDMDDDTLKAFLKNALDSSEAAVYLHSEDK